MVSVIALLFALAQDADTTPRSESRAAEPRTAEIHARHWFNNPVYRIHDDRTVVLFFFDARDEKTRPWVARLTGWPDAATWLWSA